MNCEKVQSLLVSYLNKETTPSEQMLIQAHLSTCAACQGELSRLSDAAGQMRSVLQRRAARVTPSPAAWERLEARLALDVQPANAQPASLPSGTRLSRLAPGASRVITQLFLGDATMKKRFLLAAGLIVMVVAVIAISTFTNVTQVSASSILNRAYQVQMRTLPAQGILHIRLERYFNYQGLPADQVAGTVEDTYYDLGSCKSRKVTLNSKTGAVMDVHAEDGTDVFGGFTYDLDAPGKLTVFRSPKDPDNENCYKPVQRSDKEIFDQMRSDPIVELIGQETWGNGRSVYILRSQIKVDKLKMVRNELSPSTPAFTIAYFDTQTFQMVSGKQIYIDAASQEQVVWKYLYSVDEVLPAGSPVRWDISDVKDIQIIDDPDGSNRDSGARG
jgi:hypothetical protein